MASPVDPLGQIAVAAADAVNAATDAIKGLTSASSAVVSLIPSFTQLQTVAAVAANAVGSILGSAISSTTNIVGGLTGSIKALAAVGGTILSLTPGFAQLQAVAAGLVSILGVALTAAFAGATKAASVFLGSLAAVGGGFASGILEVLGEIAGAFGTVAGAGAAVIALIPGFSQLQTVLGAVFGGVTSFGASLLGLIPGFTQIQTAATGLAAFLGSGLSASLGTAATSVKAWASGLAGSIKSFLGTNQIAWAVAGAIDKVGTALGSVGKAAIQSASAAYEFVKAQTQIVAAITGTLANAAKLGAGLLRLPFDALDSAISAVQLNVARFVKLASPALFMQFELAVQDLYGAIGHALVPVLQTATQFFRSIGGAFMGLTAAGQKAVQMLAAGTAGMVAFAAAATVVTAALSGGVLPVLSAMVGGFSGLLAVSSDFKPVFDEIAKVIGGVLNEVGKAATTLMPIVRPVLDFIGDIGKLLAGTVAEYASVFTSIGPELGVLSAALGEVKNAIMTVIGAMQGTQVAILSAGIKGLASVLAMAAPYVAAFTKVVGEFVASVVRWTAGLFGIDLPRLNAPQSELKDSTGAAARSATTGDPADALKRARESAFQMSTGPKADQQTADNTKAIATAMLATQGKIDAMVTAVNNFPTTLQTAIRGAMDSGIRILNPFGGMDGGKPTGTPLDNLPPVSIGGVIAKQLEQLSPPLPKWLGGNG